MLTLPPLALYVHIPWCVRKCPYCDFNSHNRPGNLSEDAYVEALLADLEQDLPLVWGRPVTSVFIGGGTPSLFSGAAIGAILDGMKARLTFRPGLEITMEANPGTLEHDAFEAYLEAGVNRLSIGVQSFDDGCLTRLGRIHDATQAALAVQRARAAGFDNLNIDLMYALPGQSPGMAMADLERAIELAPDHISHYQLTLEPGTPFGRTPPPGLPDEDGAWAMQEACQARLAAAGYAQYEVSAYAREGRQCAHNVNYWRFGDYLGIGAGAHGKLTLPAQGAILRRWKRKHPRTYMDSAGTPGCIGGDEHLEAARIPFDYMLNALRLREGFTLPDFEARTGLARGVIRERLESLRERGLVHIDGERITTTPLGWRFLNDVMQAFLD